MMPALARRRLTSKQAAPHIQQPPLPPQLQAIGDEGWSELTALSLDARRKHVHWTHVHTEDRGHRQPSQLTRNEFWDHLERVYKEVYPEPANKSGSILLFGMVVKELHPESTQTELCMEHHHAATYCSQQHYWKRVAQVSVEKYAIKMHAACHDGYTSMYQYLRKPSPKKPLSELDAEPFLSVDHPRGAELRRLLEAGARSQNALGARKAKAAGVPGSQGGEAAAKRVRVGDMYQIVRSGGFRHALALQAHAERLAAQGDPSLAQFCTTHGTVRLQDHLNAAWAVIDAPRAMSAAPTRLAKLRECATQRQCVCGGAWKTGAALVLGNNGEDAREFGMIVCRALAVGARRGVNVAIVGEPGCGKSMILQPLESIYEAMPPPEEGSTFPLSGLIDAEILLWQDFEYQSKTINFADLLRLLVGERIGVRIPGQKNVKCNNTAPLFYSALEKIAPSRNLAARAYALKAKAMDDRFTIREWTRPLPLHLQIADFPHCAACFASFMLDNDAAWQRSQSEGVWL